MKSGNRARAALWGVPVGLQLSALYTLLLVAILGLLGWGLYSQLDQFLVSNAAERMERAGHQALAHSADFARGRGRRQPLPPPEELIAGNLVRELSGPQNTVAVLDSDGEVITSTHDLYNESPRTLPELPDEWFRLTTESAPSNRVIKAAPPERGGGRELVMAQPFALSFFGQPPGAPLLLVQAGSLEAADAVLNQLRLYVALGMLIGTVVGVLAGLGLTRAVLRPLDHMVTTAEAIAEGDLERRLGLPSGRNEVARLGGAFDHMVERLATTLNAQRRFVADASHELRTPLTSLEGLSEMLLIGADRGDSRAVQRMVRSMHSELGRMGRLVSDLLTLSRLDSTSPMSFANIDAGQMLCDVGRQMAPVAEGRQVRLNVDVEGPVPVHADADKLKQVILNLVDNALRYTPEEGEVLLSASLDPAGGVARITVSDTGPGIAPDDLPHIFDRFYRADPSRARATGNAGLGLAIARAIVEAHGGRIEVQSAPGEGATFRVVLPGSKASSPHAVGEAKSA
jgi:two-component system OmpR family sensor kinase